MYLGDIAAYCAEYVSSWLTVDPPSIQFDRGRGDVLTWDGHESVAADVEHGGHGVAAGRGAPRRGVVDVVGGLAEGGADVGYGNAGGRGRLLEGVVGVPGWILSSPLTAPWYATAE